MSGFIFIILLLVFFIVLFSKNKKYKISNSKEEIKEIETYCKRNGLKYLERANYIPRCSEVFQMIINIPESLVHYDDIMIGNRDDIHFSIIDFNYTRGKSNYYHHTFCLLSKDEEISFPQFYLVSKKANNAYFYNSSNFGSKIIVSSEFANYYNLQGLNVSEVKKLFNSSVIEAFKNFKTGKYEFETKEEYLLVNVTEPKNVEERMQMLSDSINVYKALLESYTNNK